MSDERTGVEYGTPYGSVYVFSSHELEAPTVRSTARPLPRTPVNPTADPTVYPTSYPSDARPTASPQRFVRVMYPPPTYEPTRPNFPTGSPTRATIYSSDLQDVAAHGLLVRRDPQYPDSYCPYEKSSIVNCDGCNLRNLTMYFNYCERDLCLGCTNECWRQYLARRRN